MVKKLRRYLNTRANFATKEPIVLCLKPELWRISYRIISWRLLHSSLAPHPKGSRFSEQAIQIIVGFQSKQYKSNIQHVVPGGVPSMCCHCCSFSLTLSSMLAKHLIENPG